MKRMIKRVLVYSLILALTLTILPGSGIVAYADNGDGTESDESVEVEVEASVEDQAAKAKATAASALEEKNKQLQASADAKAKELKGLEQAANKIKADLSVAKGNVANKQVEVMYIDSQISNTRAQITTLDSQIGVLEEGISTKEQLIKGKEEEFQKNYQRFKDRLRAMYIYDNSTILGLVLGVEDFGSFLSTTSNINKISEHDDALMEKLNGERLELEGEREDLEGNKDSLESSKSASEAKRQELSSQQAVASAQVQELSSLQQEYEKDLVAAQAKSAQMKAEIENILSQIVLSVEDYVGGEMAWPTPGYTKITSSYGWRFNGSDFHTGVDLSGGGIHGKPAVAANDGEVVYVNTAYSNGIGYGIYVMVDHGGGITTLYAHLNSVAVSKGQQVKRGQTVGAVGSTGWSTGPHLHFEVRKDKKHVNPISYIK